MRARRVVGAVLAGVVVAGLGAVPASATGSTDVVLDSGQSHVPLSTRVLGASTAGVLVAKGGYGVSPLTYPGSQELRDGATTTTLPATFDGTSYMGGLNGQFATSLTNDGHVAFDDLAASHTGTVAIAQGTYLLATGPQGWVEFDPNGRTVTYVTPTGTGVDAPVTRTVLRTYGFAGETWNAAGSANALGIAITASCASCGTSSVAEVLPFDGSPKTTLLDPTAGLSAPSTQTTVGPAELTGLSCPTSTTCFGVDVSGALLTTTDATAGAASWAHSTASAVDLTAVSCPTTTFCVTSDKNGQIRTSTNPAAATPTWTNGASAGAFTQLTCPTVSLCVGRTAYSGVLATSTPADPNAYWQQASNLFNPSGLSCPTATLCLAVDGSAVYVSTDPANPDSWSSVSYPGVSPSAVSCASAALCVVSEGYGTIYTTDTPTNPTWSSQTVADDALPTVECEGVVCLVSNGTTFYRNASVTTGSTWSPVDPGAAPISTECTGTTCVVAQAGGVVATSTDAGAGFGVPGVVAASTGADVSGLACPTSTRCYLLDGAGRLRVSNDGGASFADAGSQPPGSPTGLVCPTANACLVYGGGDLSTTNDTTAGTWSTISTPDFSSLTAVTCPSNCLAATDTGSLYPVTTPFAVPAWGSPQTSGLAYVSKLSCSGAGCLATDGSASLVGTSTGTWHAITTSLSSISSLSCASATLCLALGDGSSTAVGSPATSSFTTTSSSSSLGLVNLSCASATLCAATTFSGGVSVSTSPASGAGSFGFPVATGVIPTGFYGGLALACAAPTRCVLGGHYGKVVTTADATTLVGRQTVSIGIDAEGDIAVSMLPVGADSGTEVQRFTSAGVVDGAAFAITGGAPPVVTPSRTYWTDYSQVLHVHPLVNGTDVVSDGWISNAVAGPDSVVWSASDGSIHQLLDSTSTPDALYPGDYEQIAASGVALSAGRVGYVDDDPAGYADPSAPDPTHHQPVWSRSLSDLPGDLTAGTPTLVAHTATSPSMGLSGIRTVVQDRTQNAYVVQTGSAPAVKLATPGLLTGQQYSDLHSSFSGANLLTPSYGSGGLSWQLVDVVTKAQRALATNNTWLAAHLSGRYVTAVKSDGSVVRLDLVAGTTTAVAAAPSLAPGEGIERGQVDSDGPAAAWVVRVYGPTQSRNVGGFVRSAADSVHALTFGSGPTDDVNPEVVISQQYLVRTTTDRQGLTATKLSDLSSVPVSASAPVLAGGWYDLPLDSDADVVGFEGGDGSAHVVQLPAVPDAPFVLGDASPHAFTLGGGRTWAADVVTSRPLTVPCSFTITLGATTIRSLQCDTSAISAGEAMAAWDGKNAVGAVVAPGTYTWTLSAAGADGALRRSDLSVGTVTGTVAVATADTVSAVGAAATTTSPFTVTLAKDGYGASTGNLRLRLSTSTTNLGTTVSCLSAAAKAVSCAGPFRSARITPTSPLMPGASYRVLVNPTGTTTKLNDVAGAPVTSYTSAALRIRTADDLGTSEAWGAVATSKAVGGSVAREHRAGATFTTTFSGTGVRYWYLKGVDSGNVKVTIDGITKDAVLDEYGSAPARAYRTYTGLASGTHKLVVTVLGTKRTAAKGTFGSVDAISTAAASCATTSGCTYTPSGYRWATGAVTGALGGRAAASDVLGASLSRTFVGTGFDLYRLTGPAQGYLAVYVDGKLLATVNGYATSNALKAYTRTGLSNAQHTLVVKVLHKAGTTGGAGFVVTVDRLVAR